MASVLVQPSAMRALSFSSQRGYQPRCWIWWLLEKFQDSPVILFRHFPFLHLGVLPPVLFFFVHWSLRRDLNPQPPVYETGAATIELQRQLACPQGIEPCQSVLETNSPALEHWGIYLVWIPLLLKTKRARKPFSVAWPSRRCPLWEWFFYGPGLLPNRGFCAWMDFVRAQSRREYTLAGSVVSTKDACHSDCAFIIMRMSP